MNGILAVFAPDRREVLPSMAMTSSGALVSAPTQVTKQFRKAFRVEGARISPSDCGSACRRRNGKKRRK